MPSALSAAVTLPPQRGRHGARAVVTAVFFAFALGLGLWAGSIPMLMQRAGLQASGLGLGLALHSAAYVAAMSLGGWLMAHVESRRLMRWALAFYALGCIAVFVASTPLLFTLSLILLGAGAGSVDLVMNAEATVVERELGRPVLTGMHAAASASFGIGSIGGSLLMAGVGPIACAGLACAVIAPVIWALRQLGPRPWPVADPVAAVPQGPAPDAEPGPAAPWRQVLLLGAVLGIAIAAENAAQLWSARFLAQQASELVAIAGAGAAFFSLFQAGGRVFGNAWRQRIDDVRLIAISLAVAALGFGLVALSNSLAQAFAVSLVGFALVGAGMSCVVPCCFALAARSAPQRPAAAIGTASLVAGAIRLPAPLMLGLIAASGSDAAVFGSVALALLAGVALVWRLRGPARGVRVR